MEEKKEENLKDIFLSLNGKGILDRQLISGNKYTIKTDVIVGEFTNKNLKDGDDSYNLYFKGEMKDYIEVINDKGKVIYGKTRKSQSQDYRFQTYHYNRPELNMTDQEFYEHIMVLQRHYCPEIIDLLLKWKKEGK